MNSIVDYLKQKYGSNALTVKRRKNIPEVKEALTELGINNYRGTSNQNLAILRYLQNKEQGGSGAESLIREEQPIMPQTTPKATDNMQTAIAGLPYYGYYAPENRIIRMLEPIQSEEPQREAANIYAEWRTEPSTYEYTKETGEDYRNIGEEYPWYQALKPYLGVTELYAEEDNPKTRNRYFVGPNADKFKNYLLSCTRPGAPYCNFTQKLAYLNLPDEYKEKYKVIGDSLKGWSLGTYNTLKNKVKYLKKEDYLKSPVPNALFVYPGHTGYIVGYKKVYNPKTNQHDVYIITVEGNHWMTDITTGQGREGVVQGKYLANKLPKETIIIPM